jgi:hypothetical protein
MPTSTPSKNNSRAAIDGPFHLAPAPKTLAEDQRTAEGSVFMTRKRVLVADDLAPVLNAVADLLRESFDVVGMVSDGREALIATLNVKILVNKGLNAQM